VDTVPILRASSCARTQTLSNSRRLGVWLTPLVAAVFAVPSVVSAAPLSPMESLGKQIFFDGNLSQPRGQACASCHSANTGFTSPNALVNLTEGVHRGAVAQRAGNRKPPSTAYATFASAFNPATPSGGTFWDGRATGTVVTTAIFPATWSIAQVAEMTAHLGPAADQAMGPFLNDVEQNLPSSQALCDRVRTSAYARLWANAWGEPIRCSEPVFVEESHKRIAFAVAVYEASGESNSFSSRRDRALQQDADGKFPLDGFTAQENLGHDLFYNLTRATPVRTSCARFCHASATAADGTDPLELYVRNAAGYFNIGVPANVFNPFYRMDNQRDDAGNIINPLGIAFVDNGIAARDEDGVPGSDFPNREGEFKVPTMRNVDKRPSIIFPKAFMHNGYFKSLEAVVHFYNTRDQRPICLDSSGKRERFVPDAIAIARGCWPESEVASPTAIFDCSPKSSPSADCKVPLAAGETYATYCANPANPRDIGNLCLTLAEERAIVAYLKTLSDTVTAKPPR
jgi:cytochrome c peroxidase